MMCRVATIVLSSVVLVSTMSRAVVAYNNGVGSTPPMGWNTWCTDDVCGLIDKCTEALVKQQAQAMVDSGMHTLGYQYINMDDCWSAKNRTASGELQPDPARFPSGMKSLADFVHSLGLKIGLYTCIGTHTCRNSLPGSFGHYEQDANTFAEWGIDFVKCDNCNRPGDYTEQELYSNFSHYLNKTGRPIFFSLCEWGDADVQSWGASVGQAYRIQMDHLPLWELPTHAAGMGFGQGTYDIIEYVATLKPSTFVKQYGWMDPDFLMTLFWPTMSFTYSRSEYSFWSLWSAPLIVATNIFNMTAQKQSILTNPEVIAVNQDALHTAGDRLANYSDKTEVWARPLANGDHAVILFNGNMLATQNVTISWAMLNFSSTAVVAVRDLWAQQDLGQFTSSYTAANVKPTDVQMLRVSCTSECSP